MITSVEEYQKAEDELHQIEERLSRLQQTSPLGAKDFTKAGIRKIIAGYMTSLQSMRAARKSTGRTPHNFECYDRGRKINFFHKHLLEPTV